MVDLQKLYETVEKNKKKIEKNKELFMKNKNEVHYALITLINPFLEALGWDITNPDEVFIKDQVDSPFYVLKKNGKGMIAIGVRPLYTDIRTDLLLIYSNRIYNDFKDIRFFVNTDGIRWEIYERMEEDWSLTNEITFWDIEKDPTEEVIKKALSISKILVYVPDQYGKIKIWIGNEGPFTLEKYNEILVKTAEWLIKNKYITEKDLPIRAGNRAKRYLINVTNKHENGEESIYFKRLFNGWYILTHFSSKGCIYMSKYLLEKYGKGIPLNIKYNNK